MFLTRFVTARMPSRLLAVFVRNAELLKFLTVGSIAFVVTSVLFFGLKWTVLDGKPVTANVVAVLLATVLSYVLNREWAFTARGGRERRHEAALFFVVAGVGLVINQLPLVVSRYVFALQTPHVSLIAENLADFVSATVVGTLLATVFRWWAMRKFVFPNPLMPQAELDEPNLEGKTNADVASASSPEVY
ncbi:GtrA family protein [Rhodococcus tukisamuensis]|uniref:Putative flippase GtrA (Transmembrane translocase of bactoprenol-linked glucose) n=1 Tax=Rhodococcus tukisamuensis TaxID=168276 RepID=A0A1G6T2G0_9NOCA|nr:GtrA family protein [Rhodococcus tukisamuensis]SDD23199.1 Putative flippase GtrA (transmembrane translocase of bactoprenol-linked glucose) [Rhodococcus tukisamuensis]